MKKGTVRTALLVGVQTLAAATVVFLIVNQDEELKEKIKSQVGDIVEAVGNLAGSVVNLMGNFQEDKPTVENMQQSVLAQWDFVERELQ